MSFFSNMNERLDQGWKMTNINCDKCKFSLMLQPTTRFMYCCKCNFQTKDPVEIRIEQNSDDENQSKVVEEKAQEKNLQYVGPKQQQDQPPKVQPTIEEEEISEELRLMFNQPTQSDIYSKRLSQKLCEGWAMLNEECSEHMLPIMRSKKGARVCVGCEDNKESKQVFKQQNIKVDDKKTLQSSPSQNQRPTLQQANNIAIGNTQPKQQKLASNTLENVSNQIQQGMDDLGTSLNKMVVFYGLKLDKAIQENDTQQVEQLVKVFTQLQSQQKDLIQSLNLIKQ